MITRAVSAAARPICVTAQGSRLAVALAVPSTRVPVYPAASSSTRQARSVDYSRSSPMQSGHRSAFSTSHSARSRRSSADKDLVEDPDHPSGIFYHKLGEGRYAMSLLPDRPSSPSAASVMAIVTRPAEGGQGGGTSSMPIYELATRKPDCVETNAAFIQLMHATLKEEGVPQDGLIEYEAVLRKSGWAHVSDQRHPLMPGRIPTPENIIASVAFVDEQVSIESYEPNDTYRLVTAEEGVMQLRPNWLDLVKTRCRKHL